MGKNPTDRGKIGTKRSVLTEGEGLPIACVVGGANQNDFKLFQATLNALEVERPLPTEEEPQRICLDKGYDYQEVKEIVQQSGFTPHIRARGEEAHAIKKEQRFQARRWVVERVHSWMNRFRRILVRWEIRLDTYLAMLYFACGLIVWRTTRWLRAQIPKELLK